MANSDIPSTFFLEASAHLTNKAIIKITWKNDETICTEQWPLTKEKLQATKELIDTQLELKHIQTHSCLPGPMAHGNDQADKLVSFATPEEQHALLHNNAGSLHQIWKIPYRYAKEIINNCSTCRVLHLRPIAQSISPRGLQTNQFSSVQFSHSVVSDSL